MKQVKLVRAREYSREILDIVYVSVESAIEELQSIQKKYSKGYEDVQLNIEMMSGDDCYSCGGHGKLYVEVSYLEPIEVFNRKVAAAEEAQRLAKERQKVARKQSRESEVALLKKLAKKYPKALQE